MKKNRKNRKRRGSSSVHVNNNGIVHAESLAIRSEVDLKWWNKAKKWIFENWIRISLGAIGAGITFVVPKLIPAFEISRVASISNDPMSGQFRIKNQSWLPVQDVSMRCDIDKKGLSLENQFGGSISMHDITIAIPVVKMLAGGESVTESCKFLARGSIPRGGIYIGIEYVIPVLNWKRYASQYFSFRYDSQARGYIVVPDKPRD